MNNILCCYLQFYVFQNRNINGKKYSFSKNGSRGYHEFALDILNGQLAYPSIVVFDSELNKLEVIESFKNAKELMLILTYTTES